jgi:hypothetical protein
VALCYVLALGYTISVCHIRDDTCRMKLMIGPPASLKRMLTLTQDPNRTIRVLPRKDVRKAYTAPRMQ